MLKFFKDPFVISFIFLISLLGVFAYLKYQPDLGKTETVGFLANPDQITKVEIEDNEKTELIKKDGQWLIASEENKKADQDKVKSLLDTFQKLKKGELISQNPDNFSNFSLDEEKAIKVKLFEGDNLAFEIWVGGPGPAFNKTYFRLPDEEKVYLSNVSLRSEVIQTSWQEPTPTPTGDS